jgi:hypothetical protein
MGKDPDDSESLLDAVVAVHGVADVGEWCRRLHRDLLMLFCPAYFGGKTGGKIQAAANRPKSAGAGFTGLERCLERRGRSVGSVRIAS